MPRGTPDPGGDRRFAERTFPLLEPLEWAGERHRGGYGTGGTGETIALGLVFGPWEPHTSEPRLAVTVGSELPISLTDETAPRLLRTHFVADRAALRTPDQWPNPVRSRVTIEIEGDRVELDALSAGDLWLGQGVWRTFTVEVHAVGIEPGDVRLRVADEILGGIVSARRGSSRRACRPRR